MTSLIFTTLMMCLTFAELDGTHALICDRARFDYEVHNSCVPIYRDLMAAFNYKSECPWPNTQRYYNSLDDCVKWVGNITACTEPSLKNMLFLDIHNTYFFHCPFLKDPNVSVLMLLTLPCVIITFLMPFLCCCVTTLK